VTGSVESSHEGRDADYVERFLVSIGPAWKTRVDSRFGQFAANRRYDGSFQDLDDDEPLAIVTRG
jgi:hypothetical protein